MRPVSQIISGDVCMSGIHSGTSRIAPLVQNSWGTCTKADPGGAPRLAPSTGNPESATYVLPKFTPRKFICETGLR